MEFFTQADREARGQRQRAQSEQYAALEAERRREGYENLASITEGLAIQLIANAKEQYISNHGTERQDYDVFTGVERPYSLYYVEEADVISAVSGHIRRLTGSDGFTVSIKHHSDSGSMEGGTVIHISVPKS